MRGNDTTSQSGRPCRGTLVSAHLPSAYRQAEALLHGLVLVGLDEPVIARAASLRDPQLRALDAIHIAAALSIGDDPEAFVTYDARLARAAKAEGLTVLHPGVDKLN